ncbi:MAG: nitrilase-related carbon-nitrogen hydrolase, partial [Bacteroidota bacterium]
MNKTKMAVVQAGSVLFDLRANLAKASQLIQEAAAAGAQLVLFPEAFTSGYPRGLDFGTVVGHRSAAGRALWQRDR